MSCNLLEDTCVFEN